MMAAAPGGSFAMGAQSGLMAPLGPGQFAVVSQHATWGIYETLAEAHREAELIRHSGAIMTNAVKCSPGMVRQYQMGNLAGFVELDGWAITQEEAKSKALDMLCGAEDRDAVRAQLLEHHLKDLRKRVAATDPVEGEEPAQPDALAELAAQGYVVRQDPAQLIGPTDTRYVAVTDESLWVLTAGKTIEETHETAVRLQKYFADEQIIVLKASQTLARAVLENGYEVPFLWKLNDQIACHESELSRSAGA
ncbi:MAG: hypothetical protein ACR2OJ_12960 [Hyphomicrobiales bacterium]